ncbi:MAG: hypothetical protein EOM35_02320 [Negativicutes bacterium]|nr:hypothetical protein [Negativicutes bacterium]
MNVISECVNWNAARYDRIFNAELSMALLKEEVSELTESPDLVSIADACGDILFVCCGVLWKMGFEEEEIEMIMNNTVPLEDVKKLAAAENGPKAEMVVEFIFNAIFIIVAEAARKHKLGPHMMDICAAICKSNNTKSIEGKTDPSQKANINKGPNYVPPTEDLIAILNNIA